jgi:drug/metabolite transporter (DMT)-like permease
VLALGATGILLYNICFAIALQSTSAINAALVIVINPVTTALVAVIFMGEAWSWRLGTGLVLSFLGVLTTITKGSLAVLANLTFNHGDMLLLVAVGAWSSYTILGKLLMRDMPPLLATTVSTLAGALMLVLASLHENSWHKVLNLSGQTTLELAYLVVFATVLAFVLYNIGIRRIGASRASAYINLMPVNAMWIAAVFYGEAVTLAHLAGVVLTVSGVLLITYFDGARREKKAAMAAS